MRFRILADRAVCVLCALLITGLSVYSFIQKARMQSVAVSTVQKTVYLTFDDGPSSTTKQILEVLSREQLSATFFVTAQYQDYLPLLGEIAAAGHLVAPHTYSHRFSEIYSSPRAFWADQQKILGLILTYTGTTPALLRFAGGSSNTIYRNYAPAATMNEIVQECAARGIAYVDWDVDSRDWENNRSAASICNSVMTQINRCTQNEIVVLFHDAPNAPNTAKALAQIVAQLKELGYSFDTVDNLTVQCHHNF